MLVVPVDGGGKAGMRLTALNVLSASTAIVMPSVDISLPVRQLCISSCPFPSYGARGCWQVALGGWFELLESGKPCSPVVEWIRSGVSTHLTASRSVLYRVMDGAQRW